MDRKIPLEEIRKKRKKKLLKYGSIAIVTIVAFVLFLRTIETSIAAKNIQTGIVDTGNVNATVNASGKIIPLNEEIIIAPINSRIVEVYKKFRRFGFEKSIHIEIGTG
jgi:HlyD family secretion protein